MKIGKVIFFLPDKGYGFIVPHGGDPGNREATVFFHEKQIENYTEPPEPWTPVEYELNPTKGPRASRVRILDESERPAFYKRVEKNQNAK